MPPSTADPKPQGSAAVNPDRLRPEPTPIFKGKAFYIVPGLPSRFEANLKDEIKLWGGSINSSLKQTNFVLHIGTEKSEQIQSGLVAKLQTTVRPKIRSYHWFFACIHACPPKILPKSEFIWEMPIFTKLIRSSNGEDRARPIAFWLTKNMPILPDLHETSTQEALMAVAALVEINGGEISRTRARADILILDSQYTQAQKFASEMRPDQESLQREDFMHIVQKKKPYRPNCEAKREKAGQGKAGPSSSTPRADQSRAVTADQMDDVWINKADTAHKGGRTEYTQADDVFITRWLTYHYPERTNWKSLATYETLCNPIDPKHLPWATRHSAQSWHEHVRKRHATFVLRSDKLTSTDVGLDRNLRTRAERVKAGSSDDRDRVTNVQDGAEATEMVDATAVNERPKKKVDKGKGRAIAAQDEGNTEEVDSVAAGQVEAVVAANIDQDRREEQDKRSRSPTQNPSKAASEHRRKRAKHQDKDTSDISAPAQTTEQMAANESEDQAATESGDEAIPPQNSELASHQTMPSAGDVLSSSITAGDVVADPKEPLNTAQTDDNDSLQSSGDLVAEYGQTSDLPQGDVSDLADWAIKGVKQVVNSVLGSARTPNVPTSPPRSQAHTEENSMDQYDDDQLAIFMYRELDLPARSALPTSEKNQTVAQAGSPSSRRSELEGLVSSAEQGEQADEGLPSGRNPTNLSESERRVNDLVCDDEVPAEGAEPMEVEAESVAGHGTPERTIVVTTTKITSTVVSRVESEPLITDTSSAIVVSADTPANQPSNGPSVESAGISAPTATIKSATKGKKRIANPQRAAELIKATIEKYDVDMKTVLAAMKVVAASNPEGKIDLTEVWRVIAEGQGQRK